MVHGAVIHPIHDFVKNWWELLKYHLFVKAFTRSVPFCRFLKPTQKLILLMMSWDKGQHFKIKILFFLMIASSHLCYLKELSIFSVISLRLLHAKKTHTGAGVVKSAGY